jgi:hypothetical protein
LSSRFHCHPNKGFSGTRLRGGELYKYQDGEERWFKWVG